MEKVNEHGRGLMPLKYAAKKYHLPSNWLAKEAKEGRFPCLIAEDQILFDEAVLLAELRRRANDRASKRGSR